MIGGFRSGRQFRWSGRQSHGAWEAARGVRAWRVSEWEVVRVVPRVAEASQAWLSLKVCARKGCSSLFRTNVLSMFQVVNYIFSSKPEMSPIEWASNTTVQGFMAKPIGPRANLFFIQGFMHGVHGQTKWCSRVQGQIYFLSKGLRIRTRSSP